MNRPVGNNVFLQKAVKIICFLAACFAVFIAIAFFKADIRTLLLYALYLIFGVLLPGNVILKNLRLETPHFSTELTRSFFTGFALNILLYYASALTGSYRLIFIIAPFLSVLWLVGFFRNGPKKAFRKIADAVDAAPASFFVFSLFALLYSMGSTQFRYIAPEYSLFSLMMQDYGFNAGIVNALAEGYPPLNPWIDGRIITYHYYTQMFLAIPVRLLGLTSDNLIMCCTPYLMGAVFSLSLFSFFREMTSNEKRTGLYCLAFLFANMFMLKRFATSHVCYHLLTNMDNAGLGVSCMLAALPLLKEWDGPSEGWLKHNGNASFLISVFIMIMTGIKGPIALVMVGGMTGTFLLALMMRKSTKGMAGVTLLSIISFSLIYLFVLEAEHSNASGGAVLNLGEVTDIFFYKYAVMHLGLPRSVALIILLCVFSLFFFTAFLVPFAVGYIREFILVVSGRRDFSFSRISIYASCLVGFLALMILNFSGHSQVYFGFAACVLVPVIAFWFFEDVKDKKTASVLLVKVVFFVMLCFFACSMALYASRVTLSSIRFYESKGSHTEGYRNLSASEYEGLIWLRDNTEKDALCASDRFNSVSMKDYDYTRRNNNTHFAYAIYSQRRQYLEGSGFSLFPDQIGLRKAMLENNMQMFDKDNNDRGEFARSLGVDYVIVSKRFNNFGDLSNADYTLCFSNEDMDIYKIEYPDKQ